jgi:uncharacterized protein
MAVLRTQPEIDGWLLCGGFMRIELAQLDNGRGTFANSYRPAELNPVDDRVSLKSEATVSGKLNLAGSELFVNGHVEGEAQVECDRCLKPIDVKVDTDFSLEYITGSDYESSQVAELGEEVMAVSVFDGEAIDVDEIVKEQIVLAIPTRRLCSEECKGLCPECGIDLNSGDCNCKAEQVDPRWAALKDLKGGK